MLRIFITCCVLLLCSCGGGGTQDNQSVSQVQARSVGYGQAAVILVAGVNLRIDMPVVTGVCKDPQYRSDSTPNLAVVTCTVTAAGEQPISVASTSGAVLYRGSITVPQPQVTLLTTMGNIVLELNPGVVPTTVNNFLAYVKKGFYSNTLFHRVIAGFVVQGGGFTAGLEKKAGQVAPIALESNKGLLNVRSSLAMARTNDPNSATSEFFVNLVDNPRLDFLSADQPGYAVFGKVVNGMDVVDAIAAVQTGSTADGSSDVPTSDITIRAALQTQ